MPLAWTAAEGAASHTARAASRTRTTAFDTVGAAMRSPAALLLLAAPLLACFADGGADTVASSVSGTTGEPTDTTGAGTTGEPTGTTGTTGTTTPPTTDTPTTTATTDAITTGAVDNCELAPECTAGTVENGGPCDSCGLLRRTCQPDCTWSPQTCGPAPETCEYWLLPPMGQQWQRVPVDPNAAFAPKGPVLTAIALEPQQQIYVLTAASYHVFSTTTKTWTSAGNRDDIFPQISGQMLFHGTGLADEPPDVIVTLVASTDAFAYTYIADNNSFQLEAQVPCCGPNWAGPNAPPNSLAGVRAGWARIGDPDGWITGDPQTLCGLAEPVPIYGYSIAIGDGFVYPQDIGHCFDFYPPVPFAQFPPFSYPGAPANDLIGGAAWVEGLYIFRGE